MTVSAKFNEVNSLVTELNNMFSQVVSLQISASLSRQCAKVSANAQHNDWVCSSRAVSCTGLFQHEKLLFRCQVGCGPRPWRLITGLNSFTGWQCPGYCLKLLLQLPPRPSPFCFPAWTKACVCVCVCVCGVFGVWVCMCAHFRLPADTTIKIVADSCVHICECACVCLHTVCVWVCELLACCLLFFSSHTSYKDWPYSRGFTYGTWFRFDQMLSPLSLFSVSSL